MRLGLCHFHRPHIQKILFIASLIFSLSACSHNQLLETRNIPISYLVPANALVSIQILADNKEVTALVTQEVRAMGSSTEIWDGLSDKGKIPVGQTISAKITFSFLKLESLKPLEAPGSIISPSAIVVSGKEDDLIYYILDSANNHILKLDKYLNITQQLGSFGMTQAQLIRPVDIALDSNLVLSVLDSGNDVVQRYDHRGLHSSTLKAIIRHQGPMQIPEELRSPQGISFNDFGYFLLVDGGHDRLIALNDSGWLMWQTDGYGQGPDQLSDPRGIAVDGHGRAYVADTGNSRISVFDSEGHSIWQINEFQLGDKILSLESPERLALSPEGILFCADSSTNKILYGDVKGGSLGELSGLSDSAGIYYYENILYITEPSQNRISRYGFSFQTEEQTIILKTPSLQK